MTLIRCVMERTDLGEHFKIPMTLQKSEKNILEAFEVKNRHQTR